MNVENKKRKIQKLIGSIAVFINGEWKSIINNDIDSLEKIF
jgi:hypothetical protein